MRYTALTVRFVGSIYDRDVLQALRFHARAYVHGHSVGGTNPSLLEALACGSTVIAHDNPFNREVLGDAGLYFLGEADLATQIRAHEASRNGSTEASRGRMQDIVRGEYSWDIILAEYEELFAGLTAG